METTITRRGQTVVPAIIRKRYGITEGGHLVWLDDGETIRVLSLSQRMRLQRCAVWARERA